MSKIKGMWNLWTPWEGYTVKKWDFVNAKVGIFSNTTWSTSKLQYNTQWKTYQHNASLFPLTLYIQLLQWIRLKYNLGRLFRWKQLSRTWTKVCIVSIAKGRKILLQAPLLVKCVIFVMLHRINERHENQPVWTEWGCLAMTPGYY